MDPSNDFSEKDASAREDGVGANVHDAGDHRIQFAPNVKLPDRKRAVSRGHDVSSSTVPIEKRSMSITSVRGRGQSVSSARGRQQSVHSIPPVFTEKEKDRRKREAEDEEKHVNIDEHLMTHEDVAKRYTTHIDIEKPGESQGLTSAAAEQRLLEHGPNILTPAKKKHAIIKFLEYLSSLFNLLLIAAGILEYILLGIDYHDNFQNVSSLSTVFGTALFDVKSAPPETDSLAFQLVH